MNTFYYGLAALFLFSGVMTGKYVYDIYFKKIEADTFNYDKDNVLTIYGIWLGYSNCPYPVKYTTDYSYFPGGEEMLKNMVYFLISDTTEEFFDLGIDVNDFKMYVKYRYKSEVYEVCVNNKLLRKKERTYDYPTFMIALLKNEKEYVDVTNVLKRFSGPNSDYYVNIEGLDTKVKSIFYSVSKNWETLQIEDLAFGNIYECTLNSNPCIHNVFK